MAKARFVVVLAATSSEGNTYAKRAGLPRFSYRPIAKANQVRNTQVADVHILPSFHKRPDRHAILAELRWGRDIRLIDVEMPPAPPREGDDRYGEQLTIDDVLLDQASFAATKEAEFHEADMAKYEDPKCSHGVPLVSRLGGPSNWCDQCEAEEPQFKVKAVPDEEYDPPQSHRDMVAKVLPHKDPYPIEFELPTPILDNYATSEMF